MCSLRIFRWGSDSFDREDLNKCRSLDSRMLRVIAGVEAASFKVLGPGPWAIHSTFRGAVHRLLQVEQRRAGFSSLCGGWLPLDLERTVGWVPHGSDSVCNIQSKQHDWFRASHVVRWSFAFVTGFHLARVVTFQKREHKNPFKCGPDPFNATLPLSIVA